MIKPTYEEFCDEWVPVNMSNPIRREDYYKIYIGSTPRRLYEQIWSKS